MHLVSLMIIFISIFISISVVAFSIYTGISPMPSSRKATKAILQMVPSTSHVIYELGSGWGILALTLAKQFPHATIYAYEISPFPWLISVILKKVFRAKNVYIIRKNFFQISLNKADVIICYLYPGAMSLLKNKFLSELNDDSYVISNNFAIQNCQPLKQVKVGDIWNSNIFLYQTKLLDLSHQRDN